MNLNYTHSHLNPTRSKLNLPNSTPSDPQNPSVHHLLGDPRTGNTTKANSSAPKPSSSPSSENLSPTAQLKLLPNSSEPNWTLPEQKAQECSLILKRHSLPLRKDSLPFARIMLRVNPSSCRPIGAFLHQNQPIIHFPTS